MQMKDVGQRIRNLPTLRQSRLNTQVLVARTQVIEEQFVDAFRLRIQAYSGI
jgi:hypothetical protein